MVKSMENKKLKIGIIHIYNFPIGLAPTVRITAYCKGLLRLGNYIDIISIVPQKGDKKTPLKGQCEGGNYYHFCYPPKIRIPIIRSVFWRVKNYYCRYEALKFIKRSHQLRPYDAFILSFDDPFLFNCIVPFLYDLTNVKIIAIADEYPKPIRKYLKSSVPERKLKKYRKIYKKIDGRILMTANLQKFYDEKVCPKPTLLLSTIVDTDRFENLKSAKFEREYLCYMGNMELSKDNVDNIIQAFSIIKDNYPDLDLYLYGNPNSKDKNFLLSIIAKLNLTNRVFIKGRIDSNQVPSILAGAKILVASQPDTKRAEGGFPTKLGEYFMSGVPTILTDVGEISLYVHDSINGYIVPPSRPDLYADKLIYILNNYQKALRVSQNAQKYILDNFGYEVAGEKIEDFILNKL